MSTKYMDPIDRLLAFEAWANGRIFAAVKQLPPDRNQRALTLIAHIANALRTWHDRISQNHATAEPWRELTLEESGTELQEQLEHLAAVVRSKRRQLHELVSYRTTEGKPYDTPLLDILQHLSFHSHYHRGQINAAIREADGAPVNVDFITFQREGH